MRAQNPEPRRTQSATKFFVLRLSFVDLRALCGRRFGEMSHYRKSSQVATRAVNRICSRVPGAHAMIVRTYRCSRFFSLFLIVISLLESAPMLAQTVDPTLYSNMHWRMIGPYRGGKVNGVAGVPGDPAVYYFGSNGGGVWKTT